MNVTNRFESSSNFLENFLKRGVGVVVMNIKPEMEKGAEKQSADERAPGFWNILRKKKKSR